MTNVVSVQFRGRGKSYYFDPVGFSIKTGDLLVVETSKGLELGTCTEGIHEVEDSAVVPPLRPVVRLATADDRRVAEINAKREKEAIGIAEEKILKHGLEMKLVDVECSFEGNKILFYFTADGRVDFRELVKDLAGVFRTRIELRQIGVRDEAKMLGGIGICGQPFCCSRFLSDFHPVSTKMAKTQSISLNPAKISGTCGRLMCCLRYEQDAYEDLVTRVPKLGAFVQTEEGYGSVVLVNLLRQTVKVKLDGTGEAVIHSFSVEDIAEIPGGRPAEGEPLPDLLSVRPRREKVKEEKLLDSWSMPSFLAEEERASAPAEKGEKDEGGENRSRRHRSRSRRGGERPAQEKPKGEKPAAEKGEKPRPKQNAQSGAKKPPHGDNEKKQPRPEGEKKPARAENEKKPVRPEGEKKPAPSGEKAAASRRNHHRRKPKPKTNENPQ